MNDEIKFDHFENINELLEHIDLWYEEEDIYYERWFGLNDLKKLKDYITNLQQINKNLTNSLNKKVEEGIKLQQENGKLQEQFKDWKKEIEKEKIYYLCDRTDCCGRIKDSKKYSSIYHELKDYKSRNEKAIEILSCVSDTIAVRGQIKDTWELHKILEAKDILQGSDKE